MKKMEKNGEEILKEILPELGRDFEHEVDETIEFDRIASIKEQLKGYFKKYLSSFGLSSQDFNIGRIKVGTNHGIMEIDDLKIPLDFKMDGNIVKSFKIDLEDYLKKKGVRKFFIDIPEYGTFEREAKDGKIAASNVLKDLLAENNPLLILNRKINKESSLPWIVDELDKEGKIKESKAKIKDIEPGFEIDYVEGNKISSGFVDKIDKSKDEISSIKLISGKIVDPSDILEIRANEDEPITVVDAEEVISPPVGGFNVEPIKGEEKLSPALEIDPDIVSKEIRSIRKESVENQVRNILGENFKDLSIPKHALTIDKVELHSFDNDKANGVFSVSGSIKGSFEFNCSLKDGSVSDFNSDLDVIKGFFGVKDFEISLGKDEVFKVSSISKKEALKKVILDEIHKGESLTFRGVRITPQNLSFYIPSILRTVEVKIASLYTYPVSLPYESSGSKKKIWKVKEEKGKKFLERLEDFKEE